MSEIIEAGTALGKAQKRIFRAFLELSGVKSIDKITVSELCERADVNRSTFYRYYYDIYDLQSKMQDYSIGHHYSEWKVEKAATCTATGLEARYCECGDRQTRVIAKVDHTPVAVPGYGATCTENGLTDGVVCSECGTVITAQETIPATGHVDADGDNACDVCGATIKKPGFLDKLKAFFRKIINWFKNLFKR